MNLIKKGKDFFSNNEDEKNAKAFFKKLDRNNDGRITEEDFFLALNSLGFGPSAEQLARDIFKQIDTNNNGMLDLSEAIACFNKIKEKIKRDKNN